MQSSVGLTACDCYAVAVHLPKYNQNKAKDVVRYWMGFSLLCRLEEAMIVTVDAAGNLAAMAPVPCYGSPWFRQDLNNAFSLSSPRLFISAIFLTGI